MITMILKNGERIEIAEGVAVAAATIPAVPVLGATPAPALAVITASGTVLAVFRQAQLAGYRLDHATA